MPLADLAFLVLVLPPWPPEVPTSDETALPKDDDGESWLELLRDGLDASVVRRDEKKKPW